MLSHDGHEMQVSQNNPEFERAKLLFLPIVAVVTLFFGFFYGINGAVVGFMYGLIGGLFVIHESLPVKKNAHIWLCDPHKKRNSEERTRRR